jgi:hypothetical protein
LIPPISIKYCSLYLNEVVEKPLGMALQWGHLRQNIISGLVLTMH